ncbi:hypothetical protein NPIL_84851 [Nephila pilipes]|uniref:Uncharacterized protein n=1 Tax=Nephila pilipes TaxID=299642 RepID=A0A8X6TXC2_NEPPI|nr:hypothetical protein NPIL_84851 [Nephila pilipes]
MLPSDQNAIHQFMERKALLPQQPLPSWQLENHFRSGTTSPAAAAENHFRSRNFTLKKRVEPPFAAELDSAAEPRRPLELGRDNTN